MPVQETNADLQLRSQLDASDDVSSRTALVNGDITDRQPAFMKAVRKSVTVSRSTQAPLVMRVLTALFYGLASFLIMVVNKNVLTTNKFPSFQARSEFHRLC